jgi:uncharacterized membrane protein
MATCRILFAGLIALAVAAAPVSVTLASGHAAAKTHMAGQTQKHDCHGMAPAHSPDGDMDTKCPGDGSKCCKLTGALLVQPLPIIAVAAVEHGTEPQEPAGWSTKPRPPPPRS